MVIYSNTAILSIHDTVISSCNARIVSVALDFAVLYHSLCSLALSITVPLPVLCCLFSVPSLASSQGWVCIISVVVLL